MKYRVHITAYDSHYPNPNVFHETITVESKRMTILEQSAIELDIKRKRGFSRVVIDSWEEEKPLADKT